MEIAYQPPPRPLSGDTLNYVATDLTQIDGSWANDFTGQFIQKGDFINLAAANSQRISTEPYWIEVTNRTGAVIGRFAYVASGTPGEHGKIGNVFGPGDTYVRGNGLSALRQIPPTMGHVPRIKYLYARHLFRRKPGCLSPSNWGTPIL